MKNLTKALITLKSASIAQIRAYADEVQYQLISDGYDDDEEGFDVGGGAE